MAETLTKVYGIDLGTTYSCIAYVDEHGKPIIVPNEESERITPSVVFFDSYEVIVGNDAKANGVLYSNQVVAFVKRAMGDPNFLFEYNGKTYKPEEISSFILRKLVKDAEQNSGEKITDVVITCPAYFGINEREATRIAGDIAGLNVRQIINEPTAAAISYGMAEDSGKKVVLVYDLGGGTFDITMIDISPESIEVICTGGDHNLGGKDWDDTVIQYLVSQFQEESGISDDILDDPDTCQALQLAAEKAKKTLSAREKARIPIVYSTKKVGIELTRDKFDEITENLLDRTITLTREMLEEAKKKGYETFDEIILVGGSSRMPQVAERVKKEFSIEPKLFDPDEAVAKGAALYGWKLLINDEFIKRVAAETRKSVEEIKKAPREEIPEEVMEKAKQIIADETGLTLGAVKSSKVRVKNVCSKSYGVVDLQAGSELIHNMIIKNTTIPTKITKHFRTSNSNKDSVNIRIMENELSEATVPLENAREICNALLEMPSGLPINFPIDITFSLNEEGRLDITAIETVESRELKISVETGSILHGYELDEAKCKNRVLAIDEIPYTPDGDKCEAASDELMRGRPDEERKEEADNLLKIVDDELKKLAEGQILFNSPKEMRVGLTERIVVRISRDLVKGNMEARTSRDLEVDITVGLMGRGVPQIEKIEISTVMKAELSGGDFQIDPLSEKEQLIKPTGYTQWEWNVTPLKAGRKDIHLSISVILHIEKLGDRKISHSVMEKEIKVKVNWIYGIKKNWKWIVGTIIAAIGTFIALLSLLKG